MPENIGSMIFFWEKNAWFLLKSLKNLRFKKLQFLEVKKVIHSPFIGLKMSSINSNKNILHRRK